MGHASVVKLLLDFGQTTNDCNQNILVRRAMPQICTSHTDSVGQTFPTWAAMKGDVDLVNLLLACENTTSTLWDEYGDTAFLWASKRSLQVMQCLYDTGEMNINHSFE